VVKELSSKTPHTYFRHGTGAARQSQHQLRHEPLRLPGPLCRAQDRLRSVTPLWW
jgi:hypothetical protein